MIAIKILTEKHFQVSCGHLYHQPLQKQIRPKTTEELWDTQLHELVP